MRRSMQCMLDNQSILLRLLDLNRLMELERPVIRVVSISYAIEHPFPFGSHMHDQALCFVLLTQDLPLASSG